MTQDMLDKAIEIEGLIRIVKDGNPSPETYALLMKKTEELADWAREECGQNSYGENSRDISTDTIPDSALELQEENDLRMEEAEAEEHEIPTATIAEDEDDILLNCEDEPDIKNEEGSSSTTESSRDNEKPETHVKGNKHSHNLRAAFSLNDRFLYSRELFDGDMKMFDSTLKTLDKVEDFSVAEDYFYNELDWDRDNPMVQEFMERLRSRF